MPGFVSVQVDAYILREPNLKTANGGGGTEVVIQHGDGGGSGDCARSTMVIPQNAATVQGDQLFENSLCTEACCLYVRRQHE